MSAVIFTYPVKEKGHVADNLYATLQTLWAIGGMVAVLRSCETEKLEDLALENFAEAMQIALGPTYLAVEEGVKHLRGEMDYQGVSEGCTCQACGQKYRVDILVPDELWERIKPAEKAQGAGLLCGRCIFARIEGLGEFGALLLRLAD